MKQAKIVILAGQSNAVGVGHLNCLPKHFSAEKIKEYYDGYENIKINYYSHDKKSGGFVPVTVGCTEISKDTLGPEVGMAELFCEKYPDEEIFIVKCAFGGSCMWRDWISPSSECDGYDKNSYADQYEHIISAMEQGLPIRAGWCYNELVKILGESIDYLKENGYAPKIYGFCWMQGESDTFITQQVTEYERRFDNLISDLNSSFGEYLEDCVYIDAGISEVWGLYKELNELKKNRAAKRENTVFIDTIANGLTTKYEPVEEPDTFHYDSDSVVKLGKLFAEKIEF